MAEQIADHSAFDDSELHGFLSLVEVATQLDILAQRLRAAEKPMANALVDAAIEMAGMRAVALTVPCALTRSRAAMRCRRSSCSAGAASCVARPSRCRRYPPPCSCRQ